MAFMNDEAMDQGLDWGITNGTRLHLLTGDVGGTYGSIAAADVGNAAITMTQGNGATDGRTNTCPATTVTPSGSDTVTHWAISNNSDTVVASGAFSSSFAVTSGVDVNIAAFAAITHRDPA